jgi:O-antigen/teichoic acid export membrane protein
MDGFDAEGMAEDNPSELQNRYLRNVSFSLFASVFCRLAGGLSSFLIAKTLQPANFGVWLTMILLVSYGSLLSLGTVESLLKQLPFYKGKGDLSSVRRLENVVLGATVTAAVATVVIGLVLSVFVRWADVNSIIQPIRIMVVTAGLSHPSAFFYYRFVARQDFKTAGILDAARAVLTMLLVVGFAHFWGLNGAAAGFCLTEAAICISSAILSSASHGRAKIVIDFCSIWASIGVGFPITIFWWVFLVQSSIDRLVSVSLLGKGPTGYYGLGISVVSMAALLPQSISRVLYPRINEKLSETCCERDLFRMIVIPTRIIALVLAATAGVAVIVMPVVYHRVLPKYLPGLASGQILLLLCVFRLTTTNGVNFLIATNRQVRLCLFVIVSLCVGTAAAYASVRLGLGIEGLAASTGVSGLLLALLVWRSVFCGMGFTFRKQVEEIVKLYVPFVLGLSVLGFGILAVPGFLVQASALTIPYALGFAVIFTCALFVLPLTKRWTIEILSLFRRMSLTTPSA